MRAAAIGTLATMVFLAGCHKNTPLSASSAPPPAPPVAKAAKVTAAPPAPKPPPPRAEAMPVPPASLRAEAMPSVPMPSPAAEPVNTGASARPPMHRILRASVASAPAPAAAAPPKTASVAETVHAWYGNLPPGWVQYKVPNRMTMNVGYPAYALIPPAGSAAPDAGTSDAAKTQTINKAIKVSTYMRVELAAQDDPDSFKITSPAQTCKFISLDAPTRWDFTVTPVHAGPQKKLTFTTTVLYGDADAACDKSNLKSIDVTTDTETVQVDTITARETEQALKENAVEHPAQWAGYVKYILPGGAIFTFIAGIVAWWKKRSAPAGKT